MNGVNKKSIQTEDFGLEDGGGIHYSLDSHLIIV